jgi:hypothetical protein
VYVAQVIPQIDAEIAEKGHFWMETSLIPLQAEGRSFEPVSFDPLGKGDERVNSGCIAGRDRPGLSSPTAASAFLGGFKMGFRAFEHG